MNCETCKYFFPIEIYSYEGKKKNHIAWEIYGSCECPKMHYEYGIVEIMRKEEGKDCIQIENDEGWGMRVGPKFGCIHHEKI